MQGWPVCGSQIIRLCLRRWSQSPLLFLRWEPLPTASPAPGPGPHMTQPKDNHVAGILSRCGIHYSPAWYLTSHTVAWAQLTRCTSKWHPTLYQWSASRDLMSHFQLPILPHGHFHMHTVTMLNPTTWVKPFQTPPCLMLHITEQEKWHGWD